MNSSSRERRNPKSRSCGEDGGQIHSDLCGVKARNKSTTFQIASRLGPGTCEAIRAEGEEPSRATARSDLNNNVWPSRVAFLGAIFLEKRAAEAIGCDRNDDQETADHPNGKHPHQKMRHEHEQRLEHWSRPKQTKSAGRTVSRPVPRSNERATDMHRGACCHAPKAVLRAAYLHLAVFGEECSSRSHNTRFSSLTRLSSFFESISLLACSARYFQSPGWYGGIRRPLSKKVFFHGWDVTVVNKLRRIQNRV